MEYEVVAHSNLPGIRVFVVEIFSRAIHSHRDFELCLLLRGAVQMESNRQTASLHSGELALFSPRQPHALYAGPQGALLLILQASPQFCAGYFPYAAQARFPAMTGLPESDVLRSILLQLGHTSFSQPAGFEFSVMAEVNRIFAHLFSKAEWHSEPQQLDRGSARVFRIASHIEADYAEPLRLRDLADAEGVSPDYLSHAFRRHLGMTFQDYLSQVRLEHAIPLVGKTTMTITDICAACGYSSSRYLIADFQRRMGCTPAAYRASRPVSAQPFSAQHSDTRERFFSNEQALAALAAYEQSAEKERHSAP